MSQIASSKEQPSAPRTSEQPELSRAMEKLSPSQQAALMALIGGGSLRTAADAAGVARTTLWRWRYRDPAFGEAYRDCRDDLRVLTRIALLQAMEQAASAVIKAAAEGDARIALAVLRETGVLRPPGRCGREDDDAGADETRRAGTARACV